MYELLKKIVKVFTSKFVGAGPWNQLHRAERGSPGICHFIFLSSFHEQIFYSGSILRRIIFVNVSKSSFH